MIHLGDCLDVMRTMPDHSFDAVVTDPPYGLEFMGKEWDRLTYAGGNPSMKVGDRAIADRGDNWQPGSTYGGRKKNPRCRNCGKLSRGNGSCKCPEPQWDTRHAETGNMMQAWHEAWAAEAFRLLKPGGHLLAFGGTRTYHRLASAIEDAGFEIRDTLVWAYASGFPKSLDVSKAIDKAAGAEREVVGRSNRHVSGKPEQRTDGLVGSSTFAETVGMGMYDTAPATDLAKKWDGWGTALKPAWEPIVLARKPLIGSVARNVTEWGTGGLNIDGTRIGYASEADYEAAAAFQELRKGHPGGSPVIGMTAPPPDSSQNRSGRWPANVILTDPIFDGGVEGVVGGGESAPSQPFEWRTERQNNGDGNTFTMPFDKAAMEGGYGDSGTYSRFFLIPKSARADREPVVRGGVEKKEHDGTLRGKGGGLGGTAPLRENLHPTVKPTELMRHLVRLVTPPGGMVLDPFLGSGTTGIACELEGFAWVGIEKEPEYVAIAEARLNGTQRGLGL